MIVRLSGIVIEVTEQAAIVEQGALAYEVLIPKYAVGQLAANRGKEVLLHTLEFYEGSMTGGHLAPRLVGFLHKEDRAFFLRFIEVKGVGVRKALKALSEPISRIANWIQSGDTKALATLSGIGGRAAQLMVAELRGKLDDFVTGSARVVHSAELAQWTQAQTDAIDIMVSWGDPRSEVERWIEEAIRQSPDLASADQWVRACYKIRSGSEK